MGEECGSDTRNGLRRRRSTTTRDHGNNTGQKDVDSGLGLGRVGEGLVYIVLEDPKTTLCFEDWSWGVKT